MQTTTSVSRNKTSEAETDDSLKNGGRGLLPQYASSYQALGGFSGFVCSPSLV